MAKSQKRSKEKEFEERLFCSLKSYGYLFPRNENDIERFENLYGDTEIEVPEHLRNSILPNNDPNLNFDFEVNYNVAAFTNENDDQLDFLEDDSEEKSIDD